MLIGSFSHSVDAKGRVFIPAKWREDLGATIVVTRGILSGSDAKCLFGMSVGNWKAFARRFSQLPETDVMAQAFRRMMFFHAADCEMDKQGRILVPNGLREFAGFEKEVTLIGVDNRIELWDTPALEQHNAGLADQYGQALSRLAEIGV